MKSQAATTGSAAAQAAEILREVFKDIEYGLTYRLWDGTEVRVGKSVRPLVVTFNSLEIFKYLLLHPTADQFAEAYCNGRLEMEGDVFESMEVADCIDELQLPFMERLRLGFKVWRLSE